MDDLATRSGPAATDSSGNFGPTQPRTRSINASVNVLVVPVPPRSGVIRSPAASVALIAACTRSARSCMPICPSICAAPSSSAHGFATPLPAMSGADPCTASKIAASVPILAPGASPRPPTRPAQRSEMMSPNSWCLTMTSNCCGSSRVHAGVVDDHFVERDIGNPAPRRGRPQESPEVVFMMLACVGRTFLRCWLRAISKA